MYIKTQTEIQQAFWHPSETTIGLNGYFAKKQKHFITLYSS